MKINKLILKGNNFERILKFGSGLNIIKGDYQSGKSLILNLIAYVFGSEKVLSKTVHKELYEYCSTVAIEIELNNVAFTFKRSLEDKKINIYYCTYENIDFFSPKILKIKDEIEQKSYLNFLLELIDIPKLTSLKHLAHSKDKTMDVISFKDLLRFLYVNQHDLGTNDFIGSKKNVFKKNKNIAILEILLDIINVENEDINRELKTITNEINKIDDTIKGLNYHLEDLGIAEKNEIEKELDRIENEIKKITIIKIEAMKKIEKNKQIDFKFINDIQNNNSKLNLKISDLSIEKNRIQQVISGNMLLLKDYQNEYDEALAKKESIIKMPIKFHFCECPLCNSQIINEKDNYSNSADYLDSIINDLEDKVQLVRLNIENKELLITKIQQQIDIYTEESNKTSSIVSNSNSDFEFPLFKNIEVVNKNIELYEKEKNEIISSYKIVNKIDNLKEDKEKLINKKNNLEEKLKGLKVNENIRNKKIDKFNNEFLKIFNAINNKNAENVYIHNKELIPYYGEGSILDQDSGGLMICLQISYLLGILNTSNKHPKFLMLDSINKYFGDNPVDKESYEGIYNYLANVSSEIQILVVENAPPPNMKNYIKYELHQGLSGGLINIEK